MSSARVRMLTCSLQYTLRQAYIAARPPMKLYCPKSNTAAFPIYASDLRGASAPVSLRLSAGATDGSRRDKRKYEPEVVVSERLRDGFVLRLLRHPVGIKRRLLLRELREFVP